MSGRNRSPFPISLGYSIHIVWRLDLHCSSRSSSWLLSRTRCCYGFFIGLWHASQTSPRDISAVAIRLIKGIGVALEKAELASGRAAAWSGQVRESVVEASGNVDRIENYLGYGMAKIHFNVDRISNEITGRADRIHEAVSEPLNRTGSVVRGIKAILELLTLGRPDDEGRFPPLLVPETPPFLQPVPGCLHDHVDFAVPGGPVEDCARLVWGGDKTGRVALSTGTFRNPDFTPAHRPCDLNDFSNRCSRPCS